MKIITSLFIYNFHLFVSFLDGRIMIVPFTDNSYLSSNQKLNYKNVIEADENLNELTGYNHILFGVQDFQLESYDLFTGENKKLDFLLEEHQNDISQIALNYHSKRLFTYSNDGFSEININSQKNQRIKKLRNPSFFYEKEFPAISNLETRPDYLIASVRNYGVAGITFETKSRSEYVLDEIIFTEDPQDAKKVNYEDKIVVADSIKGIIFYSLKYKEKIESFLLPNNDFPQQIESVNWNLLIKGANGIYSYDRKTNEIDTLLEGTFGALTKYDQYIFFSKKGKIYGLSFNHSFKRRNFKINGKSPKAAQLVFQKRKNIELVDLDLVENSTLIN